MCLFIDIYIYYTCVYIYIHTYIYTYTNMYNQQLPRINNDYIIGPASLDGIPSGIFKARLRKSSTSLGIYPVGCTSRNEGHFWG